MKSLIRHVLLEFIQPNRCFGVAGRSPVAARGEGAAGADFGAVGHGGAFELAGLEEAVHEEAEPFFDRRQVVLVLFGVGEGVGPCAGQLVAPGFRR